MFDTWGRILYRRRRLVLVVSLILVAFAGAWGTGVFGSLQSAGGFATPNSQSQRSSDLAAAAFGRDTGDVVVLYESATRTVADPASSSAPAAARPTRSSSWPAPMTPRGSRTSTRSRAGSPRPA